MPISGVRVANLPRRHLRGTFWHQGATGHDLTSFADPTISEGRYYQAGGAGVWYASDQEQAAWAKLFRHLLATELDPLEVRRRVGKVVINDLEVLDLTDATVQDSLGLATSELVGDNYAVTQQLATAAQASGVAGILAPSAALPGLRTLVVFSSGTPHVTPGSSRIGRPPPRLAHLISSIGAARQ